MKNNPWKVIQFIIGVLTLLLTYIKESERENETPNLP